MQDMYGYLKYEPYVDIFWHPRLYGFDKKQLKELTKISKSAQTVGYTFMRDIPVIIVEADLTKLDYSGMALAPPENGYVYPAWITLDKHLAPYARTSVLTHELAHVLSWQYPEKKNWKMYDEVRTAKDGCCPDLDRWHWHMSRAEQQLVWKKPGASR